MDWQKIFSKWNQEDEKCPQCNQITKKVRGITKQNLKRLVTPRWTINDVTILFLLFMFIIIAMLYKSETQECRNWLANLKENPYETCRILTECSQENDQWICYEENRQELKMNFFNWSLMNQSINDSLNG